VANETLENVGKLKYLGIVTNQNYIYDEFESRLNLGHASYHDFQNHSSAVACLKN
jgi:hypothetical protein